MSKKELKQAARETIAKAAETIASTLTYVDGERDRFERSIARFEVRIAVLLAEGVAAHSVLKKGTEGRKAATKWTEKVLPGRDSKTRSRWLNAGRVALILRGPAVTAEDGTVTYPDNLLAKVPGALIGSLVPLYRIVSTARTDEARAKAETLLRETYSALLDKADEDEDEDGNTILVAPTMAEVLKAAEKVAPTNRGPKAETETEEDADEDEDEDETPESRRESAPMQADPVAVESASANWRPVLAAFAKAGTSAETVQSVGLAVLRFAEEHGITTMRAVLSAGITVAEDAEKAETVEDAEKAA